MKRSNRLWKKARIIINNKRIRRINIKHNKTMKRILLFLLALILLSAPQAARASIAIDETNFPDENFRQYLLSQYYGEDGELTNLEIRAVTRMYLNDMSIRSLEGINAFTELKELYCEKNQLTELDVSGLTALEELSCGNNQLKSLNVSGCRSLTSLSSGNNRLTKLDVSKCTRLEQLGCRNNQLTTLDVRKCKNLFNFICDGNQLTELNVSGCSALEMLICQDNQLTELELPGCTKLRSLLISRNKLTSLDVSGATGLMYIYCDQNRLRGEGMDAFVASLPNVKEGELNVYEEEAGDWNAISYGQVDAARAKGWTVQSRFEGEWLEYDGEDPESVASVSSEKPDGPWYDLSGRRLQKAPQKGLYIQDRKIVMKAGPC